MMRFVGKLKNWWLKQADLAAGRMLLREDPEAFRTLSNLFRHGYEPQSETDRRRCKAFLMISERSKEHGGGGRK